jgi:hypothetical protein
MASASVSTGLVILSVVETICSSSKEVVSDGSGWDGCFPGAADDEGAKEGSSPSVRRMNI